MCHASQTCDQGDDDIIIKCVNQNRNMENGEFL